MKGKKRCKILKEIRRQIAQNNDIEFITSECKHQGDCLGTCPKCEAEVRYLERELEKRQKLGRTIAVAGLAVALTTSTVGCDDLFDGFRPTGGEPLPPEGYEQELGGAPIDWKKEEIYALQGVPTWQELPSLLVNEYYAHTLLSRLAFLEVTQEDIFAEWGDACIRGLENNTEIYELPLPDGYVYYMLVYEDDGLLVEWKTTENITPDIEVAIKKGEEWLKERAVGQSISDGYFESWQKYDMTYQAQDHALFVYPYGDEQVFIYVDWDADVITDVRFGEAFIPSLQEIAKKGEAWLMDQLTDTAYTQYAYASVWAMQAESCSIGSIYRWTQDGQFYIMYVYRGENNEITGIDLSDRNISSGDDLLDKDEQKALAHLIDAKATRRKLSLVWKKYEVVSHDDHDIYTVENGRYTGRILVYFDEDGNVIDVKFEKNGGRMR